MKLSGEDWEIRRENSVPSQTAPPKCLLDFIDICKQSNVRRVADIGAGRLRSTLPMLEAGLMVWAVDTPTQLDRVADLTAQTKRRYPNLRGPLTESDFAKSRLGLNGAVTVCVLHTIPESDIRAKLLDSIRRNTNPGGYVLIDVPHGEPYYSSLMTQDRRFRDGYVMGSGRLRTFYKEFAQEELVRFVVGRGFTYQRDLRVRRHHSLLFTARR